MSPCDRQLTIQSDPFAVRIALATLLPRAPVGGLTEETRATVEIVLAEVLNNIVEHAYAGDPGEIGISLSARDGEIVCVIEDRGREMPGGEPPPGNLPGFDEGGLPEGGFGWHLIRTCTRDLVYERRGDLNRLSFTVPVSDG